MRENILHLFLSLDNRTCNGFYLLKMEKTNFLQTMLAIYGKEFWNLFFFVMVFLSMPNDKLPTSIARITTLATLPPYIRQVTSNRPSFVDVTIEQQEIATRPRPGKNPHILYQEYIYHRSDIVLNIRFEYG